VTGPAPCATCEPGSVGHPVRMPGLPAQRLSRDRRAVLLPDTGAVLDVVTAARATGWSLATAERLPGRVRLVFRR
jgi:hypothetical protein